MEFQFLFGAPTYGQDEYIHISTRAVADKFLQVEKRICRSRWEKGGLFERFGCVNPDTLESLKRAPMPVIGFWLFPVGAVGNVPEGNFEKIRWSMKKVVDLTKHRPQLVVLRLPREE